MSLDAIRDEPIVSQTKLAATDGGSSPVKRPRQTLFFSDSDDERPPKRATPAPPLVNPNVDDLFEDLDKDEEDEEEDLRYKPLAPALDLAKLAKEAEARHARERQTRTDASLGAGGSKTTGGTVDDDGGKKAGDGEKRTRKVLPKLDEERLIGPEGFPSLIKDIKGFKPKGKGTEHTDLNRLLKTYQFWTHRMYPKTSFKDTINRVEKLCHTKRMQVRLSVWRDEFKGTTKDDDPDVIDLTEPTLVVSGDDALSDKTSEDLQLKNDQASSRAPSLPPTSSEPGDDDFDIDAVIRAEEERLAVLRTGTTPRVPSLPPVSSEVEADDFDIDAALKAEEDCLAAFRSAKAGFTSLHTSHSPTLQGKAPSKSNPNVDAMDVDEANLWEALEEPPTPVNPPRAPPSSAPADDDDDDMWNIVNEMEQEERSKSVKTQIPVSGVNLIPSLESTNSGNTSRATNDEDLDDMYS